MVGDNESLFSNFKRGHAANSNRTRGYGEGLERLPWIRTRVEHFGRQVDSQWQVIRLRARDEYLGTVLAPDEEAAMRAALKAFELDKADVKRLLVRRYR